VARLANDSRYPWHRVVSANGRPKTDREAAQWRRLRREGARPRYRESVPAWVARTGCRWVGNYVTREFAAARDPRLASWAPHAVERFDSETDALARGFRRVGEGRRRTEPLPEAAFVRVTSGRGSSSLEERLARLDWSGAREELVSRGYLRLPALLASIECASILLESTTLERFDRTVDMRPRGFGVGSYHYYREPLPEPAGRLREALYEKLTPLVNVLFPRCDFPPTLARFWERCRNAGQKRPSSILICYGGGGVNHPHRDVYGPVAFPFQALVMLARRGRDFDGGEFLLIDEGDAKVHEIPVSEGDVVVFPTRERLHRERGEIRRVPVRHGMKTVTRGKRYGLGIVFHLAE
jgi:hypothetical protein